jgi:ribosomal protein S18 acetylase RimI-like enzyme
MPLAKPITLRECTPADAPTLAIISAATLLEAFAGLVPGDALLAHCAKNHIPSAYLSYLEKPETRIWLAEVSPGAAPIGYAMLTTPDFPPELIHTGDLELRRIYLFSKFHGTGAGRSMMELAIASARNQRATRLLLGVHPDNQRAIAFYRKNGFVQIGTRTFHVGASTFEDPVFALTL